MAVPNTNTFTQQEVKAELGSSSNGLVAFFTEADDSKFDPAYKGSKNNLLNFRNYGASIALTSVSLSYDTTSAGVCANMSTFTYYILGANFGAASKIYLDSGGTTLAPSGYYKSAVFWRQWNSTTQMFTSSGGC